ncbi:nicotinamidase/pyrazinamidase [Clostridiales Family XIII bacterium PM5-7]
MNTDRILLVIDMQNDFVTGALENEEAKKIVGDIEVSIKKNIEEGNSVLFTRDTHGDDYMDTQEGEFLPVPHCIKDTEGWEIIDQLNAYANEENTFDKPSFGATNLPKWIEEKINGIPAEIELCGVCTDICVISNALILKAAFPETKVSVCGKLCAGVTPESHANALEAMKPCQVIVK